MPFGPGASVTELKLLTDCVLKLLTDCVLKLLTDCVFRGRPMGQTAGGSLRNFHPVLLSEA